jgi:RNA polymerase sigma factor (sigma-70 family)
MQPADQRADVVSDQSTSASLSVSIPISIEQNVIRAQAGDQKALQALVREIQKNIYNLAVRFLWHPQDAEDATQEILIRVITGLSSFRGESGFHTWVYRVASNALLTLRKQRIELQAIDFQQFAESLSSDWSDTLSGDEPSDHLLIEEVKIGCTLGMLQCLDRAHRMAYILGDIMDLDHLQAAQVLDITPSAFRKRLSRSRASILKFMQSHCGLIEPSNACRCHQRIGAAIRCGHVNPAQLLFASSLQHAQQFPLVLVKIRQLEETRRVAALYQSHPELATSDQFIDWLKHLIEAPADHHTLAP